MTFGDTLGLPNETPEEKALRKKYHFKKGRYVSFKCPICKRFNFTKNCARITEIVLGFTCPRCDSDFYLQLVGEDIVLGYVSSVMTKTKIVSEKHEDNLTLEQRIREAEKGFDE